MSINQKHIKNAKKISIEQSHTINDLLIDDKKKSN